MLGGCAVAPHPLEDSQLLTVAQDRVARVVEAPQSIEGTISIYEAVARALKYNLDARVEAFQAGLRDAEARFAGAQLLPGVLVDAGYTARDNVLSSAKLDLPTGIDLPATTTSSERGYISADAEVSWNLLDFALAYVRARQAADQTQIARETRRKVAQRIVEDTRVAYWRAVSSDRLLIRFAGLEQKAIRALP